MGIVTGRIILERASSDNPYDHLLATASAAALLTSVMLAQAADAAEEGQPIVWIEVGGGLDQMGAGDMRWLRPNLTPPQSNPPPSLFGKMPAMGFDEDMKVSFAPEDSDWVFSAYELTSTQQKPPFDCRLRQDCCAEPRTPLRLK